MPHPGSSMPGGGMAYGGGRSGGFQDMGNSGGGMPYAGAYNGGGMPMAGGGGGGMPPMSINDNSHNTRPPKSTRSKPKRAPLPMCAEGEDEMAQGMAMMSVVVDQQATPPASLDQMPDLPVQSKAQGPPSAGYVDLEGVGQVGHGFVEPARAAPGAGAQMFNVSQPMMAGAAEETGAISDDSED